MYGQYEYGHMIQGCIIKQAIKAERSQSNTLVAMSVYVFISRPVYYSVEHP